MVYSASKVSPISQEYSLRGVLQDRIYAGILRRIMSGEFEPGRHLVEEELARLFQVSRTPIREVLITLAKDGLVQRTRGQRTTVVAFTPEDVEEVYEIRQALECCSVRHAVRHLNLTALLDLKTHLEQANSESGPAMHRKQQELDVRLHETIVSASGNKRLRAYMERISMLRLSLALISYRDDDHARGVGQQHLAIVKALLRRDAGEAERLLAQHITEGCHNAIELFHRKQQGQQTLNKREEAPAVLSRGGPDHRDIGLG